MTLTKPMLASREIPRAEDLTYPVMVSPKLDGQRSLIKDGKALPRTFKPIPNDFVRAWCEANLPEGLDGELMLRDLTGKFHECSGAMRRKTGEPDFVFAAFDFVPCGNIEQTYQNRFAGLESIAGIIDPVHFAVVPHHVVNSPAELLEAYENFLQIGYEGLMVNSPDSGYKCGRSSLKEGILLKFKPFADEEALVIGVSELLHNENEAQKDAFGRTKRASHAEFKSKSGTMGSLQCRFADGTEFSVGTGFSAAQRAEIWEEFAHGEVIGYHVKIKHQPPPGGRIEGVAPRFPSFLGFRDMHLDS